MRRPLNAGDLRRRAARGLMRLLFGTAAQPSGEPLPVTGIHRILICRISLALGNTLLLTPLIQELEATWPGAEIDIITRNPASAAVYGRYDNVNRVFQLPAHGVGHPLHWLGVMRGMRRTHYDLAIDPDPQSQTARLFLRMARATCKLGFSSPKKTGNVTHAVAVPGDVPHNGQRPVFLLRSALGRAGAATGYPVPDIRLDHAELARGRQVLGRLFAAPQLPVPRRRTVGIFANATGPKLLEPDWWMRFMKTLEARCPDCQLLEIIPMFGRSMLDSRYPTYYSSDLRKLASVLAALDAYISLDCGIMHLACASRVPTLGIFTTTNADEWGPYGPGNHVVQASDMTPETTASSIAAIVEAGAQEPGARRDALAAAAGAEFPADATP
ncbi:MAG: glycosyltransferase family 9 protein [Xanthomonadaceae bacterium]|nr:glycosyltransferase family 9 protein [Xanthomonadaceae bacterium]MDE3072392.1 glycosyltransferase family 9 protein [Pseudomonadota bacterium]